MTCGITLNDEDYWFQNIWFGGFLSEIEMASVELWGSTDIKTLAIKEDLLGHWPGRVYDLDNEFIAGIAVSELRDVILRALQIYKSAYSGIGIHDGVVDRLMAELSKNIGRS